MASLRRVERQGAAAAAATKHWVCLGDTFVRRPHGKTRTMVEKDQERLEGEIAALHRSVQQKTSELCEIDPSISGGSDVHRSFSSLHGLSLDQVAEVLPETMVRPRARSKLDLQSALAGAAGSNQGTAAARLNSWVSARAHLQGQ